MKIGVDISPVASSSSGHKVRGVGKYIESLQNSLPKYDTKNEYLFITDTTSIPPGLDLIHYPYFELFFISLPYFKKLPTVVTVHDLTPIKFPQEFPIGIKGKLKWNIQKFLLSQVDAVVTDSKSSQSDVVSYTNIPIEKTHVGYLSVSEKFKPEPNKKTLESIRRKYNLPDSFVLYVGDVTPNKNLPALVEAIKTINLTLVMVGKAITEQGFDRTNPWNKDRVEVQKNIKDDARFITLGFVPEEDLVGIYNLADVFVMPSVYEGFGLPVLEAMSCGCPVVSSLGGSLPEVGGKAVRYVDQDISDIANGIGEVFFSKELKRTLSLKGLDQAKKFSQEKMVSDLVKVYEQVKKKVSQ